MTQYHRRKAKDPALKKKAYEIRNRSLIELEREEYEEKMKVWRKRNASKNL